MIALIRAEALKLASTRTSHALVTGVLGLVALAATATASFVSSDPSARPAIDSLSIAAIVPTVVLVLGILAISSDFRHGTITPAVLITPSRTPVLAAKVVTVTLAGFVIGLVAFGGAAAIVLPVLSRREIASGVSSSDVAEIIAGGATATALYAALGLGLGTVLRNQVGAIVGALALLFLVEPLLIFIPVLGDAVQRFGLGGLASAASGTTAFNQGVDLLGQVPAALALAAYSIGALATGAVLFRRMDVGT